MLIHEAARPAGAARVRGSRARAASELARVLLGGAAAEAEGGAEEAGVVVRVGAPRLGPAQARGERRRRGGRRVVAAAKRRGQDIALRSGEGVGLGVRAGQGSGVGRG